MSADSPSTSCLTLSAVCWQGCGVGSSSERTRTAITAALKKKLKDIMGEFSALRQKLQLEYRWAPGPLLRALGRAAIVLVHSATAFCPAQMATQSGARKVWDDPQS